MGAEEHITQNNFQEVHKTLTSAYKKDILDHHAMNPDGQEGINDLARKNDYPEDARKFNGQVR